MTISSLTKCMATGFLLLATITAQLKRFVDRGTHTMTTKGIASDYPCRSRLNVSN